MNDLQQMPRFSAAGLSIGAIEPGEIADFMDLLGEMAAFMQGSQHFITTPEELNKALFSKPPVMEVIIGRVEGEIAGFVNVYESYKLFSGRRAMHVDYLYVRPQFRNRPLAIAMLVYLLRVAKARGYRYLEGEVVDWNESAKKMYTALNAREVESRNYNLDLNEVDWALLGVPHAG